MDQPQQPEAALGNRRLAAIMFTDVVGSSRLMGQDEERTMRLIARDLGFVESQVGQHHGRVLKKLGDGALAVFDSAVHAVECAQEIQRQFALNALDLPPEEVLRHRIGIHLGDVYERDGDVFGDGVNIASRLQGEAPSGGLCISQAVYELVKHRLSLKTVYQGVRHLKNIESDMHIYQLALEDGGADPAPQAAPPPPAVSSAPAGKGGRTPLYAGVGVAALISLAALALWMAQRQGVETPAAPAATQAQPSAPPLEPVSEEPGGPLPRPIHAFRKLDGNGDKRLTPDELASLPEARRERFRAADQNGDGTVALEELQQRLRQVLDIGQPQWAQTMLWMYDQDGDGALSRDELPRRNLEKLLQADGNGDGRIVESELGAFQRAQAGGGRK